MLYLALFGSRLGHLMPDENLATARIGFVGAAFLRLTEAAAQEDQVETAISELIFNAAPSSDLQ